MIAMIEPLAGTTCASSHHQNGDDDACHGGRSCNQTRSMEDAARDIVRTVLIEQPTEADAIRKLIERSEALNWNCRRAGYCRSRRVSK
jgi:hypothetical protein